MPDSVNNNTLLLTSWFCRRTAEWPLFWKAELEARFRDAFLPAISVQKGFLRASMLRSVDTPLSYQLEFAFESEELRQGWVHSEEHQHALPIIKSLCGETSFARFDVVDKTD